MVSSDRVAPGHRVAQIAAAIGRETDGVPLFIEELTSSIVSNEQTASGQPHPRRNAVTTSPDKKDILRSGAPAGRWAAMREFNRGVAL